jgi:hypothetical protein
MIEKICFYCSQNICCSLPTHQLQLNSHPNQEDMSKEITAVIANSVLCAIAKEHFVKTTVVPPDLSRSIYVANNAC